MKQLRNWISILGILALMALFLKMPETPNVFGIFKCETCAPSAPYLPLIGAGYFATLVAISLLFPAFPTSLIARSGLIWSVLLAIALTYMDLPVWCAACLMGHACNILIWTIWWGAPAAIQEARASPFRERLCLTLLAPITMMALFSCLNLTFLVYNLKAKHDGLATGLKPGDAVPTFTTLSPENHTFTNSDIAATAGIVINFVSPNCPYCKEQLPILDAVAAQFTNSSYRFINISPSLPPELVEQSSAAEWIEDREGKLRELFKVSGYPTLFVIGADSKILQIIPGVPKDLKNDLLTKLPISRKGIYFDTR